VRSTARWRAGAADRRDGWLAQGALAALALTLTLGGLACGNIKPIGPSGAAGASGGAGDVGGAGATAGAGATGGGGEGGAAGDLDGGVVEGGACSATVAQHPNEGAFHVACTPVPTYQTNPPSSGNHYSIWADYKTYDAPVPWGHLVHSLEHGAVVIVYNCPGGCPDEVAAAQTMIDALPVDPVCTMETTDTKRRVILAPDPLLDVRWAASAWTWTLRATCFNASAFNAFATAHYGMGGEDLCTELHEPFCAVP
jgi:hypothetical protein